MTATPTFCPKRAADMWRETRAILDKPFNQWEIGEGTEVLLNTLKLNRALGGYQLPDETLEFCLEDAILETEFQGTLDVFEGALRESAMAIDLNMVYFMWCDECVLIARQDHKLFGGELADWFEEKFLRVIEEAPLASLEVLAPKVANWAVYNNVPTKGSSYELALSLIVGAL